MKKITQAQLKIIKAAAGLFLASVTLILSVCYAWFLSGNQNRVSSVEMGVQGDKSMKFGPQVSAARYYLTGAKLENTYNNNGGTLTLTNTKYTKADEDDESEIAPTVSDEFLFDNMLPGEYVDITISFYIQNADMVGSDYKVVLCGFGTGEENKFTLGEGETAVTYSILGVYQYGLVEEGKTPVMSWLREYTVGTPNDDGSYGVTIYSGTWTAGNVGQENAFKITFRIQEDFTHYYELINASGVPFDKYLSEKKLTIGRILLCEA